MRRWIDRRFARVVRGGQGLVEYALIIAIVAIICIAALVVVGVSVASLLTQVSGSV